MKSWIRGAEGGVGVEEYVKYFSHSHVSLSRMMAGRKFLALSCIWVTGGCIFIVGDVAIIYLCRLRYWMCKVMCGMAMLGHTTYLSCDC